MPYVGIAHASPAKEQCQDTKSTKRKTEDRREQPIRCLIHTCQTMGEDGRLCHAKGSKDTEICKIVGVTSHDWGPGDSGMKM